MNDDDIALTKKSQMVYETVITRHNDSYNIHPLLNLWFIPQSDERLFGKPSCGSFIVYYMPHCDKELYAKTLITNEKRFNEILIVGNCLTKYVDNHDILHKEKNEAVETFRVLTSFASK